MLRQLTSTAAAATSVGVGVEWSLTLGTFSLSKGDPRQQFVQHIKLVSLTGRMPQTKTACGTDAHYQLPGQEGSTTKYAPMSIVLSTANRIKLPRTSFPAEISST